MQRSGAFKSDREVSDGRFLRQKSRFTDWVHGRWLLGLPRRARPLPPLRRARLPVVAARDDRPPPQGPRGHDRDLVRQPLPRRARLGLRGRRLRRRPARLGLPLAGLPRERPELPRSRERARAVGPRDRPDRQQRLGRRRSGCSTAPGTSGATRRSTSTRSRCAPRSTRSTTWVYDDLNNGVYKAGFARSQRAYDEAFDGVFAALSRLEEILGRRRYLTGDTVTEADWRAWVTLVRFDPVYHTHFRLNGRRVMDQPNLWGFARSSTSCRASPRRRSIDEIKRTTTRPTTSSIRSASSPAGRWTGT